MHCAAQPSAQPPTLISVLRKGREETAAGIAQVPSPAGALGLTGPLGPLAPPAGGGDGDGTAGCTGGGEGVVEAGPVATATLRRSVGRPNEE